MADLTGSNGGLTRRSKARDLVAVLQRAGVCLLPDICEARRFLGSQSAFYQSNGILDVSDKGRAHVR